jgi:SAM-dependent methyltransferase
VNDLEKYFLTTSAGRPAHKLSHYFKVYNRHFNRFRGRKPVVLEVGVRFGGSLDMWRDYFGPGAQIIGVDIDPNTLAMKEHGYDIFLGDQGKPEFWQDIKSSIPKVDILIDDGSHKFEDQRVTFESMYDHVSEDGVFLFEDCHSSYRRVFGGGHRRRTFIEYCKALVDEVNAYWSQDRTLPMTQLTRTCDSVHFYDSIVVVEKELREMPYNVFHGDHIARDRPRRKRISISEMEPLETLPKPGSTWRFAGKLAAKDEVAPGS